MSEIGQNLKNIVIKGIDMLGSKASDFASTAKQKVDSFNLENHKQEQLAEIGAKVYEMSREGAEFPEAFQDVLKTLEEIDSQLVKLRETKKENPAEEQKEGTPAEDSKQPVYNDTAVET